MKINFIVPEIVRSGGMRVIFEYANRLTKKGHQVTLFTPVIPFNPYKGLSNWAFQKYRIKYGMKYFTKKTLLPENIFSYNFKIKYVPSINNFFIPDADAVIATSWTTSYYVNNLKISKGRKNYLIQDFEVWNCNEELARGSYRLPLKKIVVSAYLKELMLELYQSDSCEIMPGIDYKLFFNSKKVFNKYPVISFADHSLINKNVEGGIEVAKKLKDRFPDLQINAFGVSRFHEFPDIIKFTICNSDEEVRKMYCSSDIFLFPSLYEGFGLPPAEAMACQCAVVGNAVAAFPEYSVHNESAIHCDPSDISSLFDGVCGLLNDIEKLKRISSTASESIREKLNWDDSVNKFEEVIFS
ncbi:MAG: glycosyltransferase family 4 protein [bacterium]